MSGNTFIDLKRILNNSDDLTGAVNEAMDIIFSDEEIDDDSTMGELLSDMGTAIVLWFLDKLGFTCYDEAFRECTFSTFLAYCQPVSPELKRG